MRRKDREVVEPEVIKEIIDSCKVFRIAMVDGDQPYVIPSNFGYDIVDGKYEFYTHCAKEGRKIDILKKNNHVCIEMDCDHALVEGPLACNYGFKYSSIIGFGTIEFVEDVELKKQYLDKLMLHQAGKTMPFSDEMVNTVLVGRIVIDELSAKARV